MEDIWDDAREASATPAGDGHSRRQDIRDLLFGQPSLTDSHSTL